jgi:hypothetical protein
MASAGDVGDATENGVSKKKVLLLNLIIILLNIHHFFLNATNKNEYCFCLLHRAFSFSARPAADFMNFIKIRLK